MIVRRVLVVAAGCAAVLLPAVGILAYHEQVGAEYRSGIAACQDEAVEGVGGSALTPPAEAGEPDAGKDGARHHQEGVQDPVRRSAVAAPCAANVIARANAAGAEVAFVFAAVTVSIAAMGVVAQVVLAGGGFARRARLHGSHIVIVADYGAGAYAPRWLMHNVGDGEVRIDNVTVVRSQPGIAPGAVARSAEVDDLRIGPGSKLSLDRNAAAGAGDVMVVVHARDGQGEHLAWARFAAEFSPARHVKKEEGKIEL